MFCLRHLLALLVAVGAFALAPEHTSAGSFFLYLVDTTSDANLTMCVAPNGDCSLRGAINNSNADGGESRITFNVPPGGSVTISPGSGLPAITEPVEIDATTQPGVALGKGIGLDGAGAGPGYGLRLQECCSTVRGLAIRGFSHGGMVLLNADDALIEDNYIGLDNAGLTAGGGGFDGITLQQTDDATIRNNVIADADDGIRIVAASTVNRIQGNIIGLNTAGLAVGNETGVLIGADSEENVLGGTDLAHLNFISGNTDDGVMISSANNRVLGNWIGVVGGGGIPRPNGGAGILLTGPGGSFNNIGGVNPGEGNLISANLGDGVSIVGNVTGNAIRGNFIGTNGVGTGALGNGGAGVAIEDGATGNFVGGTTPAARNIISGNGTSGVQLGGNDTSDNVVEGNHIGTNATGFAALGNGSAGVFISSGADDNLIGGTGGAGNLISGNVTGINISGGDGNTVAGNLIGTEADGTDTLGNSLDGVSLDAVSSDNVIGGPARNVISGNGRDGVSIGEGSTGNAVQNNYIGTDTTGAGAVPNAGFGVSLLSSENTIGGFDDADGNVIAHNGAAGVTVIDGTGNAILRNSIYSNGDLGIDLGPEGATNDDEGDVDEGANNLQNFPELIAATSGSTHITGSLNSEPERQYLIQFFASAECDQPSDSGEGETFIGELVVFTDDQGDADLDVTFDATVQAGEVITSTATTLVALMDTSEFSGCVLVTAATPTPAPTSSRTPGPTSTATPTATPTGKRMQGDVQCDDDVDTVDALQQLRHVAGLEVFQEPGCPEIGLSSSAAGFQSDASIDVVPAGKALFGDVDCDEDVDAVDALKVLRHVAALPVTQTEPCADIEEVL